MISKRVLVVEDDRDIRELLQQALEIEGYIVMTACNGSEGVKTLRSRERPSLILLDLMMPVMNGWEFLACQRDDRAICDIPVIVVSAVGERIERTGARDFVKKPVELDRLLEVVRRYCL